MTTPVKSIYIKHNMNLNDIRNIGLAAAYRGGDVLLSYFGKIRDVGKKGVIDLITVADIESEKAVIDIIHGKYPDHSIIAEESGTISGDPNHRWIIDPLDGTTNFAHGLGCFAVSIAFYHYLKPCAGIVFNPLSQELFIGISGEGSFLNGRPIHVSSCDKAAESLLVTGFPYTLHRDVESLMKRFTACLTHAQGVRRLGSAALDLCYLACGRFDGFWEENLKPWDTAAGSIIARESGARLTDFSNQPYSVDKKEILATNGRIHNEILSILEVE